MGMCSLLVRLRSSPQYWDQLALTFKVCDTICIVEAVCSQVVRQVIDVDDK